MSNLAHNIRERILFISEWVEFYKDQQQHTASTLYDITYLRGRISSYEDWLIWMENLLEETT